MSTIRELFTYKPPTDQTIPKFGRITEAAIHFAEVVAENCPEGPDRTYAIRLIQMARMTANAGVSNEGASFR